MKFSRNVNNNNCDEVISDILSNKYEIKELRLRIERDHIYSKNLIECIADVINCNAEIVHVLNSCLLLDNNFKIIADAISSSGNLLEFNIANICSSNSYDIRHRNVIDASGNTIPAGELLHKNIHLLSLTLTKNQTLLKLCISGVPIRDDGALCISLALVKGATLEILDIRSCSLTDGGTIAIVFALEKNKTLKKIYLARNNVGNIGAHYLSEMLHINRTLQYLYMDANYPEKQDIRLSLKENRNLNKNNSSLLTLCRNNLMI